MQKYKEKRKLQNFSSEKNGDSATSRAISHNTGGLPVSPDNDNKCFLVEQSLKDNYAIKQREDWQPPMFTGMAKYLYETDEQLRFCVDAIADFARSGAGCRGGNHGAIFFDEEAYAIKSFIARLAKIAATTIKNVAQWLVWVAKEIGQLTDIELHRADGEVNDVVDEMSISSMCLSQQVILSPPLKSWRAILKTLTY